MSQVYQNNIKSAKRQKTKIANELKKLENTRDKMLEMNRRRDQLVQEIAELDEQLEEMDSDC